jgi:uncharacterized protein YggE
MARIFSCLLCVLAMNSSFLIAQSPCNQNCPERRAISLNATGTVTADADLAIVHVGYKLFDADAKSAYAQASTTSNAILEALTSSGIPRNAIESSSQMIQHTPSYELQQIPIGSEERFRRQFAVAQSWTIRVKPDDAAKTLNTAINAGANESGWIEWTVLDPNALAAQASAKALTNARIIAEQMAQKSDIHIGHLVSANENPVMSANRPINGMLGGAMGGIGTGFGMGSGTSTEPLAVTSRRIEYTVSVYAVFAIE